MKVLSTENRRQTIEALPPGATVNVTVTGVNDAGDGPASDPLSAVVT